MSKNQALFRFIVCPFLVLSIKLAVYLLNNDTNKVRYILDNGIILIAAVLISIVVYFLFIWFVRKWMIKQQVSCLWRSLFLAVFLAPGLLLYGEHAGIPLPAFAWMSGASNAYNCIEKSLFCSIELNLYTSILPFLATWGFAWMMCKGPAKDE